MSDEDALLAGIAAQPEEDTPRLAYADWLDEHADALPDPELARVRAEFIRLQTERLRCPYWLPGYTARYAELSRREAEIQSRYTAAVLGPAGEAAGVEVWFSRGLPCLRMRVAAFLANAERFEYLRAPVLIVTDAAENWYDLVTHPLFRLVTNLTLAPAPEWGPRVSSWSLDPAVVGRMGELARSNRVRGLDLSWCHVGDAGVTHLAECAAAWPRLEDLDVSHNDIEYTGLVELLLSPLPANLRRLNLCSNRFNDRAAEALAARWPAGDALKWIRLENTGIGPLGRHLLRERFGEKVELGPEPA